MKPIFFTVDNSLPLKIIPDTQAHLDGHTVIAYNYNVFFDSTKNDPSAALAKELHTDKMTDPDYYGYITFEKPGHIFSYTPGDQLTLTRNEIEEIIERLNHYRNNPELWGINDN